VGVTVTEVVLLPTDAVYEVVPELNVGLNIPLDIVRLAKVASLLNTGDDLLTVTV
jgi:hypothetical protein